MIYFVSVCIEGRVVQIDIWSLVFVEKYVSYSKFVYAWTGGERRISQIRTDMDNGEGGRGGGSKIAENMLTSFMDGP